MKPCDGGRGEIIKLDMTEDTSTEKVLDTILSSFVRFHLTLLDLPEVRHHFCSCTYCPPRICTISTLHILIEMDYIPSSNIAMLIDVSTQGPGLFFVSFF